MGLFICCSTICCNTFNYAGHLIPNDVSIFYLFNFGVCVEGCFTSLHFSTHLATKGTKHSSECQRYACISKKRKRKRFSLFWFALFSLRKVSSVKISQLCSTFVAFLALTLIRKCGTQKKSKRNINKYVLHIFIVRKWCLKTFLSTDNDSLFVYIVCTVLA